MSSKTDKNPLLLILLVGVVLVIMIVFGLSPTGEAIRCADWTGFCEDTTREESIERKTPKGKVQKYTEITKHQSGKTLWDWLGLAGVIAIPIVLFQFERNEQRRAEYQAESERDIANEYLRDEALQAYIDRMSELLLNWKLIDSRDNDPVRDVARTRTLTILRRLRGDGERKARVLHFLYDAGLLEIKESVPLVNLKNADFGGASLSDANLEGANLEGANLEEANLERANLEGANLEEAKLERAKLERANLKGANLYKANLEQANLSRVSLYEANLEQANLSKVSLYGANLNRANLNNANLEEAVIVEAGLKSAKLTSAKLKLAKLNSAIVVQAIMNGADLEGADLKGAVLLESNLYAANPESANLEGTLMVRVTLERANLEKASLEGANLEGANLEGAKNCIPNQIKAAKDWEKAHYSPDFRQELGLPPEYSNLDRS